MKKTLIGGFAVIMIAIVAAFNLNIGSNKYERNILSLANIEALAQEESGGSMKCYEKYTTTRTIELYVHDGKYDLVLVYKQSEVECIGTGETSCTPGIGEAEYIGYDVVKCQC